VAETAAAIETLLDDLAARGLLSEERYVASVLHRRAPRLGAARIRQELRAQGVPDAVMRDSLQGLAESEETRARAVWQRRFGTPPGDAREHARQGRFLMARGFSAEIVQRILRRPLIDDADVDTDADTHSSSDD
jgi:regulatory protein